MEEDLSQEERQDELAPLSFATLANGRRTWYKNPFMWIGSIFLGALLLLSIYITAKTIGNPAPNYSDGNRIVINDPTIILISLDGFKPSYFQQFPLETEHLRRLGKRGVMAKGMKPVFPSKTFPNHYTIVTGLYPPMHGIVANTMYDPVFNATFTLSNDAPRDGRWWDGEPIWVTSVLQNQKSATYFWPGSEAKIKGTYPTYWVPYDESIPFTDRIDQIIAWLKYPREERPTFLSLYMSQVDSYGHTYGPSSPKVGEAIQNVDNAIGDLMYQLAVNEMLESVHIIVTSDHGMTDISSERVILLDELVPNFFDYVDRLVDAGVTLSVIPKENKTDELYNKLKDVHPQLFIYKKEEIPEYWHYRDNRRITPIFGVAAEGWQMSTSSYFNAHKSYFDGGAHGYDNRLESMQATFIASGPLFKKDFVADSFDNIHLYDLMCHILKLNPAPNNGSLDAVQHLLA